MATLASEQSFAAQPNRKVADWRWIGLAALAIILTHLFLALTKSVNWDEFHHFDHVRQLAAGTLAFPLQTFHARLFAWTLSLPGDVTIHIRAARLVSLACACGTALAIFGISRNFASERAAALIALAYLSGGYVILQGTSFRADPQAAALLMAALWLLACRPLRPLTVAVLAALTGLAAMLTIKAVIYAPAFAAIAWLRWHGAADRKNYAVQLVAAAVGALVLFVALFAWHSTGIAEPPVAAGNATVSSAGRVVFSQGLLPQWPALVTQIALAPHLVLLLWFAPRAWRQQGLGAAERRALIGLMLPLAVLLVYRNSYPYFFVFLLPPVLVAAAPVMDWLLARHSAALLALPMAALAVLLALSEPRGTLETQRRTIAAAHQTFPQPVTYFDFSGYLGDYDRGIPFMPSGWGLAEYRAREVPLYTQTMERKAVPLLLANHGVLVAAIRGKRPAERLLDTDAAALRENYIHHWGPMFVAGRRVPAGLQPIEANFLVPGPYTLEDAPLMVDGVARKPGDVVTLARGFHAISGGRTAAATLRWGDHLRVPAEPAPSGRAYDEF